MLLAEPLTECVIGLAIDLNGARLIDGLRRYAV
jgi:hypothetical protein